jgi:hypothetical protein
MSQETTAAELGRCLDRLRANQREIERTLRALSDVDRRRLWLLCVDTAARADISPRVRALADLGLAE